MDPTTAQMVQEPELLQEGLQSHHGASKTAARLLCPRSSPGLLNPSLWEPTGPAGWLCTVPLLSQYPGPHGEE